MHNSICRQGLQKVWDYTTAPSPVKNPTESNKMNQIEFASCDCTSSEKSKTLQVSKSTPSKRWFDDESEEEEEEEERRKLVTYASNDRTSTSNVDETDELFRAVAFEAVNAVFSKLFLE